MFKAYIFLFIAVFFGTSSNIFAKDSNGFSKIIPSFASAITIILCMYFLSQTMKYISASYTYATFAGLCILSTTVISIIKYNNWPNFYSLIGILLIIIGSIMINLLGKN